MKIGSHHAKVERHGVYNTPRKIYDFRSPARKGRPEAVAKRFLKTIAKDLKIDADLKDLKFDKVVKTPLGNHVYFQQYYLGKPISGAWLKVDLDQDNRIYNVVNSCVPVNFLKKPKVSSKTAALNQQSAIQKAKSALGLKSAKTRAEICAEFVMFPVDGKIHPAWKVIIPALDPPHDWKLYIDAQTGSVLHKEDMLKMAPALGRVFDPNPVVALNDTTLRESKKLPAQAYRQVELTGLAVSGYLEGPFVTTSTTTKRYKSKNGKFLFTRDKRPFKEVMVYFHIDRVQRYIQSLGFDNINHRPIPVNIDGLKDDQSYYSSATKSLTFGTGGVDDAEDAEIILHEYGHSIQDNQVPGFGSGDEAGAMGEGFGDYLAASFFADQKPERLRLCVGSWDATSYSPEDPPCLRRLDSNKRYPRDMVKEEHTDGEIWSACLWQIREAIGREAADKLILAHHFLIRRDATFKDAVIGLVLADRQLYQGAHEAKIREIFIRRGILPSPKTKRTGYDPFSRHNRPEPRSRPRS